MGDVTCNICGGDGEVDGGFCTVCMGTGAIPVRAINAYIKSINETFNTKFDQIADVVKNTSDVCNKILDIVSKGKDK